MRRIRFGAGGVAFALVLVLSAAPDARAGAPTDQLKGAIDRVVKTLDDPALKGADRAPERRRAVRKVANDIFDFIEIAGVEIGRVDSITLGKDYQAQVRMTIRPTVTLQDDSIASIKTKGLIGERYIRISPGGSEKIIPPNGRIKEVEAPVDFEELLSKYVFGKV